MPVLALLSDRSHLHPVVDMEVDVGVRSAVTLLEDAAHADEIADLSMIGL